MAEIITSPEPNAAQSSGSGEHTYKFNVKMNCSGCSGAIERVLKKLDGVDSYTVSLEDQTAEVHTSRLDYGTVLAKIKNTGKTVVSGEEDGESRDV